MICQFIFLGISCEAPATANRLNPRRDTSLEVCAGHAKIIDGIAGTTDRTRLREVLLRYKGDGWSPSGQGGM